ncbi:MAG: AI-2E family transporter [Actinomycetaceae bacterium]|nr:AI-2E family transporter [Actinomycetaceae bacterium]
MRKKIVRISNISDTIKNVSDRLRDTRKEIPAKESVVITEEAYHPNTTLKDAKDSVPGSLRVAAAWSWRIIVVIVALAAFLYAASQLAEVVIPVFVALLLTVLLDPITTFFRKHTSNALAATASLLIGLAIVIGLFTMASTQIVSGMGDLMEQARHGVDALIAWSKSAPFGIEQKQMVQYLTAFQHEAGAFLQKNGRELALGAVSVTTSITKIGAAAIMSLFCLFFFMKDGRKIWHFFLRCMPYEARNPVNEAAIRGWVTISSYARTQMQVAAIDAISIGIGAWLLDVPLSLPLGVLVFLGSFIPIVGAISTGAIAVLVALVDKGPWVAVAMLGVILFVQQVESHILQPLMMGHAVNLHPLAVLLAVAAGAFTMGIFGAMFAVPIMAFLNTSIMYLHGYDKFLRLNYEPDRPGGPPGQLDEDIRRSLEPSQSNLLDAAEAREKLEAAGGVDPRLVPERDDVAVVAASEAQKAVGDKEIPAFEDQKTIVRAAKEKE